MQVIGSNKKVNTMGGQDWAAEIIRSDKLADTRPWIETMLGDKFHIPPDRSEINIHVIAANLSKKGRFGGHCKGTMTVGQHSCLVHDCLEHQHCPPAVLLSGLLHDANEAYLPDLPSPWKLLPQMSGFCEIEDIVQGIINARYGIRKHDEVKRADKALVAAEARDFMPTGGKDWECLTEAPWPIDAIEQWDSGKTNLEFMTRFNSLYDSLNDRPRWIKHGGTLPRG